jgi:diguanylate cyclase (GGDEF)-like protein
MPVKIEQIGLEIPGLELQQEIGRGSRGIVYRARWKKQIVAVKVAQDSFASASESHNWFRREGAILACVAHPGLAEIIELGSTSERPYLVRELVEGRTITAELAGGPLSQDRIVSMAVVLAGALGEVHRHGLVHRDVKPQNIMLLDNGVGAKLIDFGLATRFQQAPPDRELVGTFLYSAPEQSGMVRRPVDGRSDLYSLGVVMFECCTASPPFTSEDVGELIRCHAVVAPPDLRKRNPKISAGLAAIIARLMAKDPDDRYQTGDGLAADLGRLEAIDEAIEARRDPRLGITDQSAPASFEPRWVGRHEDLTVLLEHYHAALRGNGSLVLIEGEPGSGKSRLVREMLARTSTGQALCLGGRCSPGDSQLGPLRRAVEAYLQSLRRLTDEEARERRKRLRMAAGEFAPLVARLSPALAAVLLDSATTPPFEDVSDQFYQAVTDWLLKLVDNYEGAVLWLDDLQWLDEGTRKVLWRISSRLERVPVLLVGCLRNDEASLQHVTRLLANLEMQPSARLVLAPLSEDEVGQLVVSHLGGRRVEPGLIRQLTMRSQGNPFSLGEYIRAVLDGGLLRPVGAWWRLDQDGLERLELPTDVLKLVLERVEELDEPARQVLNVAAVVGQRFDLKALTDLAPEPDGVPHAIGVATELRLLERVEQGLYRFVHDRIRETFLSNLSVDRLRHLHQQVAEWLDRAGEQEDGPELVYARARHYALAQPLRIPKSGLGPTPGRVFETNLEAGRLALKDFAFEQAYDFLSVALSGVDSVMKKLEGGSLFSDPELFELLGRACLHTARLDEGMKHLEHALARSTDSLQRARLLERQGEVYMAVYDVPAARQKNNRAFREMGETVGSGGAWQNLSIAGHLALWVAGDLSGQRFSTTPAQRERLKILSRLYEQSALQSWFEQDYQAMLELGGRFVLCAWRLGPSRELVRAYAKFAYYMGLLRRSKAAEHYIRRGKKLARELGDPVGMAHVTLFHALSLQQAGQAVNAELMMGRHLEDQGQWLDSIDYSLGCTALIYNLLTRGRAREAWMWVERAYRRQHVTNELLNPLERLNLHCYAICCRTFLGRPLEAIEYLAQIQERFPENGESPSVRSRDFDSNFFGFMIGYQLEQGELGEPLDQAIERFRALKLNPARLVSTRRFGFIYQAYARLAQCQREVGDRALGLARLKQAAAELKRAATIPSLEAHSLVIEAALLRLDGTPMAALSVLARAELLACQTDNLWALFELALERANVFSVLGNREAACEQARGAYSRASAHGWAGRAYRISREYPLGTLGSSGSSGGRPTSTASEGPSTRHERQLAALLQVSLATGSVTNPNRQARVCLDELIRLLGAERGFLFLCPADGALTLLAGRSADGNDLEELAGFSRTVVEEVRARRRALVVSGTEQGLALGSESVVLHDLRSIIATPLNVRDQLVGVVYLDNRLARGVFTEDDVAITSALSNHIAIALENARTTRLEMEVEAERRQRDLAETIRDLTTALASTLKQNEVLQRLIDRLGSVVPFQRARGALREGDRFRAVAYSGAEIEPPVSSPAHGDTLGHPDLLAHLLDTGQSQIVVDSWRDERFAASDSAGTRAWMAVPVLSVGEVAAVVILEHQTPGFYNERLSDLCLAFASQAGVALENARLFAQVQLLATTDGLTGLFNRRHFFEAAAIELRRARRLKQPLSAIMMDVDHFKSINDTYGHAAGDGVLRRVAELARQNLRDIDVIGRYGGEEFAIILPQADVGTAFGIVAERLRKAISMEPLELDDEQSITVTVSLGVAELDAETPDLAALLNRADTGLYAAKKGGRNRAVCG